MPGLLESQKKSGKKSKGLLERLSEQDFDDTDSQILSALMHPGMALGKMGNFMSDRMNTGMGMSQPPADEASIYNTAPIDISRLSAANDIAQAAQVGAMPMSPGGMGGMMGANMNPFKMRQQMVGDMAERMNPQFASQMNKYFSGMMDDVPMSEIKKLYGNDKSVLPALKRIFGK